MFPLPLPSLACLQSYDYEIKTKQQQQKKERKGEKMGSYRKHVNTMILPGLYPIEMLEQEAKYEYKNDD